MTTATEARTATAPAGKPYALGIVNRYKNRGRTYGTTTVRYFATPGQRMRYASKVQADAAAAERAQPWSRGGNRLSRVVALLAWEGDKAHGEPVVKWTPAAGYDTALLSVRPGGRVFGTHR